MLARKETLARKARTGATRRHSAHGDHLPSRPFVEMARHLGSPALPAPHDLDRIAAGPDGHRVSALGWSRPATHRSWLLTRGRSSPVRGRLWPATTADSRPARQGFPDDTRSGLIHIVLWVGPAEMQEKSGKRPELSAHQPTAHRAVLSTRKQAWWGLAQSWRYTVTRRIRGRSAPANTSRSFGGSLATQWAAVSSPLRQRPGIHRPSSKIPSQTWRMPA